MHNDNVSFDLNTGGTKLFIVQLVFLLAAWIISLMRAYVKLFIVKKVTQDDYWMLPAVLFYTAYGTIVLHSIAVGGTGKHINELTLDGAETSLRAWYLCEVLYGPMSACIRTSVAVFLLRLTVKRWHRWTVHIVLVITWVISIGFVIPMAIQCSPPSYYWKQVKGAEGSCIHPVIVPLTAILHGIISAVCDWVLGLLPIVLLWNVQISRRTKISIAALLSMGIIAGIALVIRIPYIKTLTISVDFLYETVNVAIWSVLEPGLGIIAGGIATLRPLAKSFGFGHSGPKKYMSDKRFHEDRRWSPRRSRQILGGRANDSQSEGYVMRPHSNSLEIQLIETRIAPGKYEVDFARCCPWEMEAGSPQQPSQALAKP